MPKEWVQLEFSDEIAKGLASGVFTRQGGTVRNQSGHVVKLLSETAKAAGKSGSTAPARRASGTKTSSRGTGGSAKSEVFGQAKDQLVSALIEELLPVVLDHAKNAAVSGTEGLIAHRSEMSAAATELNSALDDYVLAVANGKMRAEIFDRLIQAWIPMKDRSDRRMNRVLGTKRAKALRKLMAEYTARLVDSDSELRDVELLVPGESISDMTKYLSFQRDLYVEANRRISN